MKSEPHHYVAVDLGAESGRVMLGSIANGRLSIQEVHRFPNGPIQVQETTAAGTRQSLRWDFERLMTEIRAGLQKAVAQGRQIVSIGIDTWGVDFGLLDAGCKLLENPYHYRDGRTNGVMEKACQAMGRERLYGHTGIQLLPFNSLYQVMAMKQQRPEALQKARHLLFMPDLITHALTGEVSVEYTIASTSQMMDMATGQWSDAVLKAFDLPGDILPGIVKPRAPKGRLKIGGTSIPVIAVGTHDTASAVAGVPSQGDRSSAYLSSGTWSLMGVEMARPVINERTCALNFTNEGGVEDTIRLLENIMGLWLVQECRRHWAGAGQDLDYGQLARMASSARPFTAVIDTEYSEFLAPGQMPDKINRYLQSTGQQPVTDKGQMIRVILDSLALRYAQVLTCLEELCARPIDVLHIVGGGIQNELLNELTADATGKTIITGPVEATVIGNVLVQALAAGQIASLAEGRKVVAASFETKQYRPKDSAAWVAFKKKRVPRG